MAKVGKLNVQLTATSRGLARGLGHGTRLIRGFAATNTALIGGLTGTFGKLAGLAGIGGIGASMLGATVALKKGADAVDNLAKQSQKLLGTRNTGALAGIRHAADDAGVPIASLEKGMEKLADTLVKAGRGERASVEALERVGLTAKQLRGLRPEEQLGVIADRLGAIGDTNEKISLSRGIFGKAGSDLIGLFDAGSKGIAAATEEMRLFGFAIRDVDAMGVEAANDAIAKLKKIGEGVAMQFAVQFAPIVEAVSMKLVDLVKTSNGVGGAVENAFTQGIGFTADFLDAIEGLEAAWLRFLKKVADTEKTASMFRWLDKFNVSDEAAKKAELEKRVEKMPAHRREQFRRMAMESGGFQDERVTGTRIAEGFEAREKEIDERLAELEAKKAERGSLGTRFKDFIYEAQTSAMERAENTLLKNEEKITDELRDQKGLREQTAGLDSGFMAFGGPEFNKDIGKPSAKRPGRFQHVGGGFLGQREITDAERLEMARNPKGFGGDPIEAATLPGERGKMAKEGGDNEAVDVLKRIDSKLGRGVPVVYA